MIRKGRDGGRSGRTPKLAPPYLMDDPADSSLRFTALCRATAFLDYGAPGQLRSVKGEAEKHIEAAVLEQVYGSSTGEMARPTGEPIAQKQKDENDPATVRRWVRFGAQLLINPMGEKPVDACCSHEGGARALEQPHRRRAGGRGSSGVLRRSEQNLLGLGSGRGRSRLRSPRFVLFAEHPPRSGPSVVEESQRAPGPRLRGLSRLPITSSKRRRSTRPMISFISRTRGRAADRHVPAENGLQR